MLLAALLVGIVLGLAGGSLRTQGSFAEVPESRIMDSMERFEGFSAIRRQDSNVALPEPDEIQMTIESAILEPQFEVSVLDYGAVGNGVTDDLPAFLQAIEGCASMHDGCKVVVPGPRIFHLRGPLILRSNVWIELRYRAVVEFDENPALYKNVYTSFEGQLLYNYCPMIYADRQRNVGVIGDGIFDARGSRLARGSYPADGTDCNRSWCSMFEEEVADRNRLHSMSDRGVPVDQRIFGFQHNSKLRPNFIEFVECDGVVIKDVNVFNSPMWSIHLLLSKNILVRGIVIRSFGWNTDGIDPECSENVLIEHVLFDTGDDALAIKGLRNKDGLGIVMDRGGVARKMPPTRNVVVRNCDVTAAAGAENRAGLGGIAIGSEISAGCDNIWISNISISYRMRGIYLKTNTIRGGFVTNLRISNIVVRHIRAEALRFSMDYHPSWDMTKEQGREKPIFANITLSNIWILSATTGVFVSRAEGTVLDVSMHNLNFGRVNHIAHHSRNLEFAHDVNLTEYLKDPVTTSPLGDFQYRPPLHIPWLKAKGTDSEERGPATIFE
jgi:polygalacturonase